MAVVYHRAAWPSGAGSCGIGPTRPALTTVICVTYRRRPPFGGDLNSRMLQVRAFRRERRLVAWTRAQPLSGGGCYMPTSLETSLGTIPAYCLTAVGVGGGQLHKVMTL